MIRFAKCFSSMAASVLAFVALFAGSVQASPFTVISASGSQSSYSSFSAACEAAADGCTIRLNEDYNYGSYYNMPRKSGTIVFDLNGRTFASNIDSQFSTLIIRDSVGGGQLRSGGDAGDALVYASSGGIRIEGGYIGISDCSLGGGAITVSGGYVETITSRNGGSLNVLGGYFKTDPSSYLGSGATVESCNVTAYGTTWSYRVTSPQSTMTPVPVPTPVSGLVAWYKFDGNANDSSGNGNHGILHGVTATSDRFGNSNGAYYFGSGNYISVPSSDSLNSPSGEVTISTWARIDNWYGDTWAAILDKGYYQYSFNLKGIVGADSELGYGLSAVYNELPIIGTWNHLAVTYTGGRSYAYLNGRLVGTYACNGSFSPCSSDLEIGRHYPGAVEYLYGAMDDLRIYNRALSAAEVAALYSGTDFGAFTVTQYNFNQYISSLSDVRACIADPSTWRSGCPITKYYPTIAFEGQSNYSSHYSAFDTVAFPGHASVRDHTDYMAIAATGIIYVPQAGSWTFDCGHDDGFELVISGQGQTFTMSDDREISYQHTTRTFNFPVPGFYTLSLLFFEVGGGAWLDLSAAPGSYSSFSSSYFKLVGDPAGGITLVASSGSVAFGKNGGAGGDDRVAVAKGKTPASVAVPTRAGYVFAGYWTSTGATGELYFDEWGNAVRVWDKALTGVTLWAKWTLAPLRITFGKNGGAGGDDYVTVICGNKPHDVTVPLRTGYTFGGYWTSTGAGGVQYFDAAGRATCTWDKTSDATLWAKWTGRVYTVTFGKNGGTGGVDSVAVTYGSKPAAVSIPTKGGAAFAGYWTSTGAGGVQYFDGSGRAARAWDKASNATLWAKWTNRITLGKNGGAGGDDVVTVPHATVPHEVIVPTRAGYVFDGYWTSLSADGTQAFYADGTTALGSWSRTSDLELWAKWTRGNALRVTLDRNGGTGGGAGVSVARGVAMPRITMPTRTGYVFGGYWTTPATGGVQYYRADGTSARNWNQTTGGTLYARWTAK